MRQDTFYGRPLSNAETGILADMRALNPGQHVSFRAGVTVTRALWGPWFYVQAGRDGYRSECDAIGGAVHARNLIVARS